MHVLSYEMIGYRDDAVSKKARNLGWRAFYIYLHIVCMQTHDFHTVHGGVKSMKVSAVDVFSFAW